MRVLFGVMRDKGWESMLQALAGVANEIVLTRPRQPRSASPETLRGAVSCPVRVCEDPVEAYREVVASAGRSDLLVQTFTDEDTHSRLSTPEYAALLAALAAWIETRERPTPQGVADACPAFAERYREPCLFDPTFQPEL